MQAVPFSLPDQDGIIHTLDEFKGKWLIVYFYPKDDTPGCTTEACNFRDGLNILQEKGVAIVGVSKDSIQSHKKFAEKYHLNFPLLSDPSLGMIKIYKAWGKKKFLGREYDGILRITYLIDPRGEIKKIYEKVNTSEHATDILNDLKTLQQ